MSNITRRFNIPYPEDGIKPWFAVFESMIQQLDSLDFAAWEDQNLIVFGGGTVLWNGLNLSWSSRFAFQSPSFGREIEVELGNIDVGEGDFVTVDLTRGPTSNQTSSLQISQTVTIDSATKVFAFRPVGSDRLYFFNGLALGSGESSEGFVSVGNTVTTSYFTTHYVPGTGGSYALTGAVDHAVAVDSSLGTLTVDLPPAPSNGQEVVVKDVGTASISAITVSGALGPHIIKRRDTDGGTSLVINRNLGSVRLVFVASEDVWVVLAIDPSESPTELEIGLAKKTLEVGEEFVIPEDYSYIVFDTFNDLGTLTVLGDLVIL